MEVVNSSKNEIPETCNEIDLLDVANYSKGMIVDGKCGTF